MGFGVWQMLTSCPWQVSVPRAFCSSRFLRPNRPWPGTGNVLMPMRPLGIPAHVTVLFPFMPPEVIGPPVLGDLGRLFGAVRRFRFELARTGWFGDEVLWLAPRDSAPFRALTRCVYEAFPAFPPFGGRHADVIPHLTVGNGRPVKDMRAAEKSIQEHLPIEACAAAVTLMTEQSCGGQWARAARFTLA